MSNLAWIDVETTGLNAVRDDLLEVALVVTDTELNELIDVSMVLKQTDVEASIAKCDDYVFKMHSGNGLFAEMLAGDGVSFPDAAMLLVETLRVSECTGLQIAGTPYKSPICGSTVSFDRGFLRAHLPLVESCFSHRHIDVSTITELHRRWYPAPVPRPDREAHRALADIRNSIALLKWHRANTLATAAVA